MKNLIVIQEIDLEDKEQIVVGVADSLENAEKIISDYYGEHKEISYTDIRDSNLEYSKVLEMKGAFEEPYQVMVWLEWFTLNEA